MLVHLPSSKKGWCEDIWEFRSYTSLDDMVDLLCVEWVVGDKPYRKSCGSAASRHIILWAES
jgi:hypothetical protein